jgi:hypothetical protein
MNTVNLARNYAVLTPEERFRLIVAAGGRGDDAEQSRLCQAGKSISLRMPDYSPWSHAFEELTMVVLLELLDDVARHHEAFERWCDACHGDEGESKGGGSQDAMIGRMWDLYRVQGFILKSKIAGWKLFCQRLSLPPFTPWQCLPGFARLEHAMDLLETVPSASFEAREVVDWLHRISAAKGHESPASAPISAEVFADDLDRTFRTRVKWWGG